MSRLPVPGGDNDIWGQLLNDFLAQSHDTTGNLKSGSVGGPQIQPGAIDGSKLAANSVTAAHIADNSLPQAKVQGLSSALSGKVSTAQIGIAGGIATLGGDGKLNSGQLPDLSQFYNSNGQGATLVSYDGSAQPLKLVAMPDGSVRAVPGSVAPPDAPTNTAVQVHLSFVKFTWAASTNATSYRVYRDGTYLATVSKLYYIDGTIQVNNTYQYTVVAVDQYSLWSIASQAAQAVIDPSINSAPLIDSITIWPTNPRPTDKVYIHVNARDVDAHQLATVLGVSAGSLASTFDPTTWIWQEA